MKIYASNLCKDTTEDQLRTAFSAFGKVDKCGINTGKTTQQPNQNGWIDMQNEQEANAAIKGLNGSKLGSENIKVSASAPADGATARAGASAGGGGYNPGNPDSNKPGNQGGNQGRSQDGNQGTNQDAKTGNKPGGSR